MELDEFHDEQDSKLNYFEKFRGMEPYFKIDEKEWTYIKENFSEEEIKESLVKILMEYPLPYMDISKKEAFVRRFLVWLSFLLMVCFCIVCFCL